MQTSTEAAPDLAAMFQADFGETVATICQAVRDVYGDPGAQMLLDAVEVAVTA